MKNFIRNLIIFLKKQNVINTASAIVIGSQIDKISSTFVNTMISPIFDKNDDGKGDLNSYRIALLGRHFKVGLFITELLKSTIVIIIIYIILSYFL